MTSVDLNADMGESFGAYKIGDDAALLSIVSSANIACGFHGGDPLVMDRTIKAAKKAGVRVGAHPGFDDLAGFGRRVIRGDSPDALALSILYQIGAFRAIAEANAARMAYVKLHGALANLAMAEAPFASVFLDAMERSGLEIPVMAMPLSQVEAKAQEAGRAVIREAYADRAYMPDGTLMGRSNPGAVLHDPEKITENVLRMLEDGFILAHDGTKIAVQIDSICIHGDNPEAIRIAEGLRNRLEAAGVTIAAMPERDGP